MKVYLADTGVNIDEIAIFDTERKALDYIIQKKYSGVHYEDMSLDWKETNARRYVVEIKVKYMEETITISKKEYESLLKDSKKLSALEAAGVNNWDGYDYAIELMQEME
jgi:hypothetical protein